MAYCVNCGVKLEESLEKCPLCNTPVYHPDIKQEKKTESPYPSERGTVEKVRRTDIAILLIVLLGSTAAGCGLLNLFVYTKSLWSLYVITACAVILLFCLPVLLYRKLPFVVMTLIDGGAVLLYAYMVAVINGGLDWFRVIAVPVILLGTILTAIFIYLKQHVSKSILFTAMLVVIGIAIFCVGVNISIRYYFIQKIEITWSAVVLVCAAIITIALITVMRVSRLREEVRRRMHL